MSALSNQGVVMINWEDEVEYFDLGPSLQAGRIGGRRRARELAQELLIEHPELPEPVLASLHSDQPMRTVRQGIRQARSILDLREAV